MNKKSSSIKGLWVIEDTISAVAFSVAVVVVLVVFIATLAK